MRKHPILLFALLLLLAAFVNSCQPADPDDPTDNTPNNLGWYGNDNMSTVQTNVTYFGANGNLPSSVDLVPKFPPVGDQGQYGTCVAWAVAYNHKTAINGMDKGYDGSQLGSQAYQFSPKDLFIAIPDQEKGADCNGTNFGTALDVLQTRGVATFQTVPYNGLGNCSSAGGQASWATEAGQHKIKYWRKVQADSPDDLKTLLADNIPLIFGAKLADNFMTWNSDAVLSSNTSYLNVGQHAYHAMVLAGYDDGKNAFKVINSWGTSWGDYGYIWIDYNFFLNEFCQNFQNEKSIFMAVNEGGDITPPDDPDPVSSGVDLAAWVFSDYAYGTYQGYPQRFSEFNVYNIGNQTANASSGWSVYCLAFNAYDANDYGVLFSCTMDPAVAYGSEECLNFNTCSYNVNIPSGSDFAYEHFGTQSFGFYYTLPYITGYYYLVIYIDPFNVYTETDETNNFFYPFYDPIYFVNGVGFNGGSEDRNAGSIPPGFSFKNDHAPIPANLKHNDHFSLLKQHPNAYRQEELTSVISASKNDGRWDKKLEEMRQRNAKR